MEGAGDDLTWEGLACPPLEDYAFEFNAAFTLDGMLDHPLLQDETHKFTRTTKTTYPYGRGKELVILKQVLLGDVDHSDHVVAVPDKSKANHGKDQRTESKPVRGNHGKGKDFNTAMQAMGLNEDQIQGLLPETEQLVETRDKKRKFMDQSAVVEIQRKAGYICEPVQQRDKTRLDDTTPCHVHKERKADYDSKPMQLKNTMGMDHANQSAAVEIKRKAASICEPVQQRDKTRLDDTNPCHVHKKRKADYDSKPVQIKNTIGMDKANQSAAVEIKRIADYDSKFEASRESLHKAYEHVGQAKQQRRIQVIDFQKLVTEQPRSKAKAKGRSSLSQKLMAMGTHRGNKKFPPCKMFSSCC